jgi:hypothetical protein
MSYSDKDATTLNRSFSQLPGKMRALGWWWTTRIGIICAAKSL